MMKTILERRQTWPSATRASEWETETESRWSTGEHEKREWSLSLPGNKTAAAPPPPRETAFAWRRTAAPRYHPMALWALPLNLPPRPLPSVAANFCPPSPPPTPNIGLLFGETFNRPLRTDVAAEMKVGRGAVRRRRACLLVAFSRPNRLFNVAVLRENKKRLTGSPSVPGCSNG